MCLHANEHSLICFRPIEYIRLFMLSHVSHCMCQILCPIAKWCPVYVCFKLPCMDCLKMCITDNMQYIVLQMLSSILFSS